MKMNQSMLYMRYLSLLVLVLVSFVSFGQAPSNYTNINGRYRWIAGMFDSTFHIPKGTTPSLRTGGSTNAGALFYRTSDSTVRYWTGSQWLTLSDTTRFVPYVGATKDVDLDTWSLYAKSLHIKGTAGQGHLGLKFQSATPNMSANESGVYADASGNFGIKIDNAYTSIFKTNLNSADRTYTFQNKSYTVADSADVAAKIEGTLISGYLTKATGTKTIDTSQIYQTNGKIGIGRTNPTAKVDVYDSLGAGIKSTLRAQINTDVALDVKTVGNRGFALIVDQADSSASGTQYQTLFRKSMMPGTGNPANGGGVSWYTQIGNDNNVYRALSVYRARVIDSTGFANSNIEQTSTEFWTRKAGVWDTTLVLNGGNVGINTGQNGIDSALTVANGTWLKRGVRMSALPTGVGTKALRIDANGTLSIADTLANGISGTGTTNYIPKFTGSTSIGNSMVTDDGTTVTVNGASTVYFKVKASTNSGIDLLQDAAGTGYLWNRDNAAILFGTNNNEYMRLTSGGSLGLGTSSPAYNLHISSSSNEPGIGLTSTATGGRTYRIFTNPAWSTGSLQIYDATADDARISILSSGNVGIGNISPSYKLDVNGSFNFTTGGNYLTYNSGILYHGNYYQYPSGNNYLLFARASGALLFGSNDTERMRLDASGRLQVGGTTEPGKISLYQSNTKTYSASSSNDEDLFVVRVNGSVTANQIASLQLVASANSGTNAARGIISVVQTNASASTGDIVFQNNNAGTISEKMRLDASGNLGLGTSSPAYKLDVNGYIRTGLGLVGTSGLLMYGDASSATGMLLSTSGNLGLGVTPSAWYGSSIAFQTSAGSIYTYSTDRIFLGQNIYVNTSGSDTYYANGAATTYRQYNGGHYWYTAPSGTAGNAISFTQAMTLDASGRLGIGTTSPNRKLVVQGNYDANEQLLYLKQGDDNGFSFNLDAAVTGNLMIKGVNSGTETSSLLTIRRDNGNVGIGTTSPGRKLEIASSNADSRMAITNSVSGGGAGVGLELILNNADASIINYISGNMIFGTNAAERMRITSGGNVGIGTSSPAAYSKLQVKVGTDYNFAIGQDASAVGIGAYNDAVSATSNLNITGANILFSSNGERMRLTSSGELLINTTSDAGDYKLQVNGNVYTGGELSIVTGAGAGKKIYMLGNTAQVNWMIAAQQNVDGTFEITPSTTAGGSTFTTPAFQVNSSGNGIFAGSIKTAAPSAGNAAAWKLGERVASAGVTFNDQQYIQLDIAGTTYYLATVDLPMPEAYPQATSGPSNNYKMAPVQVRTTKDVEIEKLRKEIEELKQLIKNK